MSVTVERVRELVLPLLVDLDVELYDVDYTGGSLRVTLDRVDGLDVDRLTAATRAISAALDEADVVPSAYTLEVSTPGVERPLRSVAHFERAVGSDVKIKTRPGVVGDRRVEGRLEGVDDGTITVVAPDGEVRTLSIDDIERANITFDWEPNPKPGGKAQQKSQQQKPKQQKSQQKSQQQKSKQQPSAGDSSSPSQSEVTP